MKEVRFVKDYKEDEQLRTSFFELAKDIFGLNFESWYEKGFWGNRYVPFSYAHGGKIVANVSVSKIDLLLHGKKYSALQIGTVMTHPAYRSKGLSARLMTKVLEEFKGYDFMYLFANDSVLDFYPKFGFKEVEEYRFSMDFSLGKKGTGNIRKLDMTNGEDTGFVFEYVRERVPVSQIFAAENIQSFTMYHCLNYFPNNMYYIESEDAVVIYKRNGSDLDIFDIISKKTVNIEGVLAEIADENTRKVIFRYTPDYKGIQFEKTLKKMGGVLFVKSNSNHNLPEYFKHPITSKA